MKEFLILGLGGLVANLAMLKILYWKPKFLYNNSGEVAAGTEVKEIPAEVQPLVDKVVQARVAREREKYADYETLKQRVAEFENMNNAKQQQELEAQRKYEEVKMGYESKIKNFTESLTAKERQIQDMQIGHSLTSEVFKQNGYAEETLALLKPSAFVEDGAVKIKVKDASGQEETLSVEEGVKRFLTTRPHLVKANVKSGSGTSSGGSTNGGAVVGTDLSSLNVQLMDAINSRDLKRVSEIKAKIQVALATKGVAR
jgi:hypothetical protein